MGLAADGKRTEPKLMKWRTQRVPLIEAQLESGKQGRVNQNAQAAILIAMVERHPDTAEHLSAIRFIEKNIPNVNFNGCLIVW